ncbi:MAG: hypothetical protein HYZ91_05340 [Candidatus Omnitrophica bacterium]|nr:hypothetical protein [Candidatus Omnitrophota bacterium]
MAAGSAAWSDPVGIPEQEGTTYSITYEVNPFEIQMVKDVLSFKVASLGSKEFLVFEQQVLKLKVRGYLDLKQVRAILPTGVAAVRMPSVGPKTLRLLPPSESDP